MRKYKLNPSQYDFIWKVINFDYFFFSFWLNSEYCRRDFFYTNKDGEWKTYLGQAERRRISRIGTGLMENPKKLENYGKKVYQLIKTAKKLFKTFSQKNFSKLSNQDLAKEFIKISIFCTKCWNQYFFTEFFCYDEVYRIFYNKLSRRGRLKRLSRQVQKMQRIKYDLRKELNKTIFGKHIFLKILKEISKRLKIELNNLYKLDYQEIVDLLQKKKAKWQEKSTYIVGQFSNWELITGHQAVKLIKMIEDYHFKRVGNLFRGQIGNQGYYCGRVKVIPFDVRANLIEEMKKMKKGEVLVSGSTGPEMILACRKAGAIVTEEGGITSHAAIVSRELGIPCVIGTKIATKVLKDGDLVEVDATKGMVRKLK